MAYTDEQLQQVRQAIADLALGQRVTKITHNGRSVEYAAADIDELRELARVMGSSLASQANGRRSRTRRAITSKGL